jgi:hypothetical protein
VVGTDAGFHVLWIGRAALDVPTPVLRGARFDRGGARVPLQGTVMSGVSSFAAASAGGEVGIAYVPEGDDTVRFGIAPGSPPDRRHRQRRSTRARSPRGRRSPGATAPSRSSSPVAPPRDVAGSIAPPSIPPPPRCARRRSLPGPKGKRAIAAHPSWWCATVSCCCSRADSC